MNDKLESFGEYIKRERNMRGVTIEEIGRVTNINTGFLNAIENDQYEDLPADVFVRGFLKSYAKCIGVDSNEMLLAYSEYIGTKRSAEPSDKEIDFITKKDKKNKFILFFSFFCVLAVGAAIIFFFKNYKNLQNPFSKQALTEISGAEGKNETKQQKEIVETAQKKEIQKEVVEAAQKEKIQEKDEEKKIIPEAENISLTVYASENVWLQVTIDEEDIDGGDIKEALLHEGEQVTFKAVEKFLLTLGNVKGTIVTVNGEELIMPESASNVLRNFEIRKETTNE